MVEDSTWVAGIDTGKKQLDVAVCGSSARLRTDNATSGHEALVAWLRERGVRRVGIEASGGYERAVVRHLRAEGFEVVVLQPLQVRAYAGFRLQRAKNDRIDAALIATCAAAVEVVRQAPDPRLEAFAEQLTMIEQLEEDIARWKTRRDSFRDPSLGELLEAQIKHLMKLRSNAIAHLQAALREHGDLARRLDLLQSIPGLGLRTALALVVRMPELGTLSREQVAALAGLAPYDDESGRRIGERHIAGGRQRVRKSLYAAAMPAAFHWNPALIALYRRLIDDGKGHKRALIACARKLLIYANTVLARGTPWMPASAAR